MRSTADLGYYNARAHTPFYQLSPSNPPKEAVFAMSLKGYYDSSGTESDPNTRSVTLAGYMASYKVWAAFESVWREMLAKHNMRRRST